MGPTQCPPQDAGGSGQLVLSQNRGTLKIDPTDYNPDSWDPRKGTANFGKPSVTFSKESMAGSPLGSGFESNIAFGLRPEARCKRTPRCGAAAGVWKRLPHTHHLRTSLHRNFRGRPLKSKKHDSNCMKRNYQKRRFHQMRKFTTLSCAVPSSDLCKT